MLNVMHATVLLQMCLVFFRTPKFITTRPIEFYIEFHFVFLIQFLAHSKDQIHELDEATFGVFNA